MRPQSRRGLNRRRPCASSAAAGGSSRAGGAIGCAGDDGCGSSSSLLLGVGVTKGMLALGFRTARTDLSANSYGTNEDEDEDVEEADDDGGDGRGQQQRHRRRATHHNRRCSGERHKHRQAAGAHGSNTKAGDRNICKSKTAVAKGSTAHSLDQTQEDPKKRSGRTEHTPTEGSSETRQPTRERGEQHRGQAQHKRQQVAAPPLVTNTKEARPRHMAGQEAVLQGFVRVSALRFQLGARCSSAPTRPRPAFTGSGSLPTHGVGYLAAIATTAETITHSFMLRTTRGSEPLEPAPK